MQPRLMQLRRLVIGEAGALPGARPRRSTSGARDGRSPRWLPPSSASPSAACSQLDDPVLAAAHFNWLVMSAPVNQAMLLGDDEIPARAELDRYADAGVRAFLAAYGRRG